MIEFTINTYPKNLECTIAVLGEKGTVEIGGAAVNELNTWDVENYPKPQVPRGIAPNVYANGLYQGSCPNHISVYKNLVRERLGEKHESIMGKEAKNALKIIDAIYESARKGKEIKLN